MIESYIEATYTTNVTGMINTFYNKSQKEKIKFQSLKVLTLVSSLFIPVLISLPIDINIMQIGASLLGFFVAILIGIESIYHFKENWLTYASISRFLDKEWHFYTHNAGQYYNLGKEEAFRLFVEHIESELSDKHIDLYDKLVKEN
jgi:hypothetical protein